MKEPDELNKLNSADQFKMKLILAQFQTKKNIREAKEYAKDLRNQLNEIIPDDDLDYIQSNFGLTIEKQLSSKSKDMKKEIANQLAEELKNEIDF